MIGASTHNIGTLVVNLAAETVKYEKGMQNVVRSTKTAMSKSVSIIAQTAKIAAAALAATATATIAAWAQVDDALTKSTSIMTGVTISLRKEMEMTARQMATQTVTSASQLAEAYYFLASAGLTAEQSMAALGTVERFAVAGAFDMARATDLLTDAQTALGLAVKDSEQNMKNMTRVSDVLAKASTMANASIELFSESLTNKAATALASTNKELEEGVAVLAVYADAGVKGRIAGERLNILLRELQRTARTNAKDWATLGVAVYDSEGNFRNISDIVADLEGKLAGMSVQARSAAIAQLGLGSESQDALIPLIGMSEKLKEYEANLKAAGGTTNEVAEKQLTSFNAQMKILWNRATEVAITIGEKMAPALMALNDMFKGAYEESDGFKDSVTTLGDYLGAIFLAVIGAVGDSIHGWKIIFKGVEVTWKFLVSRLQTDIARVQSSFEIIGEVVQSVMSRWQLLPLTLKRVVLEAVSSLAEKVESAMKPIITFLNDVAEYIEKVTGKKTNRFEFTIAGVENLKASLAEVHTSIATARTEIGAQDAELGAALSRRAQLEAELAHSATEHQVALTEAKMELLELISETPFSEKIAKAYEEVLERMQIQNAVTKQGLEDITDKAGEAAVAVASVAEANAGIEDTGEGVKKSGGIWQWFGNMAKKAAGITEDSGEKSKTVWGGMTTAFMTQAKKQSGIAKAQSIIQTTMDTYKSATGAYSAMASIPYVGPALGAAAAAVAIAMGMANVASIKSQNFAGNYAEGGIVPGSSYVGDNLYAGVNSGEMILNAAKQSRLLNIADGKASPASGTGSIVWNLHITNNVGGRATARVDQESRSIEVLIEDFDRGLANRVQNGNSAIAEALDTTRGLRRIGV